jgi:hypothetical protein
VVTKGFLRPANVVDRFALRVAIIGLIAGILAVAATGDLTAGLLALMTIISFPWCILGDLINLMLVVGDHVRSDSSGAVWLGFVTGFVPLLINFALYVWLRRRAGI